MKQYENPENHVGQGKRLSSIRVCRTGSGTELCFIGVTGGAIGRDPEIGRACIDIKQDGLERGT